MRKNRRLRKAKREAREVAEKTPPMQNSRSSGETKDGSDAVGKVRWTDYVQIGLSLLRTIWFFLINVPDK
ncbi:hypothetical protein ACX0G7_09765 [Flavitalea antarctica]